jgi:transcriptional regulator with XRE-family HTH domain
MNAFGVAAQRKRLGRALAGLRGASGHSQPQFAEVLGWSQSKVSRSESGDRKVAIPEVDTWCRAAGVSNDERQELLKLAEEALFGPTSWDEAGTLDEIQLSMVEAEHNAGRISVFQPVILPGLLQTIAYGRRIFETDPDGVPADAASKLLGRMDRQRILYDDSKRFRFVLTEAALRWPMGPPAEHIEQLDRVAEVMIRPNIELGILPMRPPAVWKTNGFVLFEDNADGSPAFAHLEVPTRPVNDAEPAGVKFYRDVIKIQLEASVRGDAARAMLAKIRAGA